MFGGCTVSPNATPADSTSWQRWSTRCAPSSWWSSFRALRPLASTGSSAISGPTSRACVKCPVSFRHRRPLGLLSRECYIRGGGPRLTARHVLVVDDEAHIREVVEYALTREGFRVSAAADGQAGIDLARRDPPDLIVLDVMLPEINGLEVCRILRSGPRLPILFLSARAEEIDRIVGLELGGDDYLTKPFSPRELVARVRAVLRRFDDATLLAQEAQQAPRRASAPGARPSVLTHDGI